MNKSTVILFVTIAVFSFLQIDCKKDIVDPSENDTIKPGSRNYAWTIDTLKLPYGDVFTPTRIWGSAPNDVWVTGFGDAGNLLWHFDGVRWVRDSTRYLISPSALWGTASNNIWLGNSNSTIWRYDGTKWNKFGEYSFGDYKRVSIECIYGTSANNIYAVGFADQSSSGKSYCGVIMHFNGSQWQFVQIPEIQVGFSQVYNQITTGLSFLWGTKYETTGDTNKIFTFDGKAVIQIHSSAEFSSSVNSLDGEVYIVINKRIYKYIHNKLEIWKDLSTTDFIGSIYGRSEKDFICLSKEGLGHYNGTDFETIYKISNDHRISGIIVFKNDIFFQRFSISSNINIVVHGKLQE